MAKTPKKAWHRAKAENAPSHKDDGTRWRVVRGDVPVYGVARGGITRAEAERLAGGLLEPAEIVQINTRDMLT